MSTVTRKSLTQPFWEKESESYGGLSGEGDVLPSPPHPQTVRYRGRGWDGSREMALAEMQWETLPGTSAGALRGAQGCHQTGSATTADPITRIHRAMLLASNRGMIRAPEYRLLCFCAALGTRWNEQH